jgi:hypothetical protein
VNHITCLGSNILVICSHSIGLLEWPIELLIWFCVIVARSTFCLNVIKAMHQCMHLGEIPIFALFVGHWCGHINIFLVDTVSKP